MLFRSNKKFRRANWMERVEERLAGFGVLRIRIEIAIECQKKKEDLRVRREQSFRMVRAKMMFLVRMVDAGI